MFIQTLFSDPRLFFSKLLIVVFSISLHEYVHTLTAYKLGDATAAERGHLTLNPFKQMGIISLIMLCFLGLAWGQVPVNPANLRGKHSTAIVAASGPVTNIVLSLIFCCLAIAGAFFNFPEFAGNMLLYGAVINMVLAFFNLLPVPGLDGWNILRTYWRKDLSKSSEFFKGAFFILIMLVLTCFEYVTSAAAWVVLKFCNAVLSLLGGVL